MQKKRLTSGGPSHVHTGLVNRGLENCKMELLSRTMPGEVFDQSGKFSLQIVPQTLVGAAYGRYASVIANRMEVKDYPGCGCVFFPDPGRQKH